MIDPPTTSPAHTNPSAESLTLPLFIWLMAQLIALALAAGRVPFSANFPQPAETLALHEMLIAQFAASSLFMPLLVRSGRAWFAISITAAPMMFIAGSIASQPVGRIAFAWSSLVAWLAMLALWWDVVGRKHYLSTVSIASFLTLGGLVLAYVESEYGNGSKSLSRFSPLWGLLESLDRPGVNLPPLLTTLALLITGAIAFAISRRKTRISK